MKHGSVTYQRDAYNADVALLASHGTFTPAQVKEALAWSANADAARLAIGGDENPGPFAPTIDAVAARALDPWAAAERLVARDSVIK